MLTLGNMFTTLTTNITPSPISTPIEGQETGATNVDRAPVVIAVVVSVSVVAMMLITVVEITRRRQKKHQACDISTLQDQQLLAELHNPVY